VTSASSRPDRRLVVATLNRAKGCELVSLLAGVPYAIVLFADVPGAALPEEGGHSYAENALVKARTAARVTGALSVGDDSGLEVDALGGAPGLFSARFGGGLDDRARTARLLEALQPVPDGGRTARFHCVIAVVDPAGTEQTVEGVIDGEIARAARGAGGFGYDPVFVYPPLGRTLAELTPEEKAMVSHRGRAVAALKGLLVG
jgi:XTP/dITP diphosphohydrolase